MTVAAETPLKLNVGAGEDAIPGYVTVDQHGPADVQSDMGDLPYEDGSVDEIYCCHALEHVGFNEVPAVLREWHRVLRPGGLLRLIVPSLDFVCAVWLYGGDRDYARQIMFGNQEREGEYHKTGWKPEHLWDDLEAAGFRDVTVAVRLIQDYQQESIIAEATR